MILRWDDRALRELEAIHEYISRDNPGAAKRVIERIEQSVAGLSQFPFSGRPGVVRGTRLLSVPGLPYIVVYRVRGEAVDILAVLHAAQRRRS
jgi:toxin ParE1/3/4